ncbi:MAG: amidase domain-containing protein [Lachnospiraceae bacterium]|jgi:hypothetical protein|nr:amidase domain-containing protein [Lachnospiraceae bacterium]
MVINMIYEPTKAVSYAHLWAYSRNPAYYDFSNIGGDCTNFISQCLYAGSGIMNYTKDVGWFYVSENNRSAAWSGVEYLYKFLTTNKGPGPFGTELPIKYALPGDVIQLSFTGNTFEHSLLVVENGQEILITTHSDDSDNRPLNTYKYQLSRLIHIDGVRY